MVHRYTKLQSDFIYKNIKGRSRKEIAELFNNRFKTDLTVRQITGFIKNHKLSSGLTGHFKKGVPSWNKGMKGLDFGGEQTRFKKGHRPHNYKPVGTERINGEGYIDVKVLDPSTWRSKHVLIWEKENGPLPKGYVIIFGDGNRLNTDIDNLILVSRKQLAILNRNSLIQQDVDLTKTGIIVADIYGKIGERKRANK